MKQEDNKQKRVRNQRGEDYQSGASVAPKY